MKALSKEATAILQEILTDINNTGDHKKLDSNPSFMPLYVECVGTINLGKLYSLAHYGKLCGDPMKDPEMTFLKRELPDRVQFYPFSFQNDYAGYYREGVSIIRFDKQVVNQKAQAEQVKFAEIWLRNIQEQQLIKVPETTHHQP